MARVQDWIIDREAVGTEIPRSCDGGHIGNVNAILEETSLLGDIAFPIPANTLPCQENGPNNRMGTILLKGMWTVRMQSIGYEPQQWGDLTHSL